MPAAILTSYHPPTNDDDAHITVGWGDRQDRTRVEWVDYLGIADNHDHALRVFIGDRRMGGTWARGATECGFAYVLTPATRSYTAKGAPTTVRIVAP